MEPKTILTELERRIRQLELVNRVARQAVSILNPDQLAAEIVTTIWQSFGYYNVILLFLDEEKNELGHQAMAGAFADIALPDYRQKVGEGLIGWAAQTGQSVLSPDVREDPRYVVGFPQPVATRSEMCIPLKLDDRVIGVLDIQDTHPHAFDDRLDVQTMETLADQIALAIRNAQLFQSLQKELSERTRAERELERRADQVEAIRQVGLEILAQLDLPRVLHSIVVHTIHLLDGTAGGVYIYHPEEDCLEWTAVVGPSPVPPGTIVQRGEGVTGRVLRNGEPVIIRDYAHWEGRVRAYNDLPLETVIGAPIHWKQEFLGVLLIEAPASRTFTKADVELIALLANQASIAIRNARLYTAERDQRRWAQALEAAAAALNTTLDLDEVLHRILEQVENVVPAEASNVMLVEGDVARIVKWRGYEHLEGEGAPAASDYILRIADFPILTRIARTGEPVVVASTATEPDWAWLEWTRWIRSCVIAPIRVGNEVVGYLNVIATRPNQFDLADAQRLATFASHAATAIQNARLHAQLHRYAAQLEDQVAEQTAELRRQYAHLDAILRSTTDGIVVTDAEGEIIRQNPVTEAWLQKTLSPDDVSQLRKAIRAVGQQAAHRPTAVLELTGADLELKASPVLASDLDWPSMPSISAFTPAAVIVIRDISHIKALERMKTRFITNMSHELRTPITTIKLYVHLMQQHPERWQEYLPALAQEAEHQAQLVQSILQISRIDAGRLEMHPGPVDINPLVQALVADWRLQALERRQKLTVHLHPAGLLAWIDPEWIRQALSNLVENAILYTPAGGEIAVSTAPQQADARRWATVTVADTGIGIPASELEHVFERFFRGEEPRRMQVTGAGLGLSIADEIVKLHGGRITVESGGGDYTTFTVWLPIGD